MSPDLPAVDARVAFNNFIDLAEALGGLTPLDEQYLTGKGCVARRCESCGSRLPWGVR